MYPQCIWSFHRHTHLPKKIEKNNIYIKQKYKLYKFKKRFMINKQHDLILCGGGGCSEDVN